MGILSWILVGLVAGWLADMVMKGRGSGILFSLILGVVGALLGGFLAAVVLILIVRALPGRSPV